MLVPSLDAALAAAFLLCLAYATWRGLVHIARIERARQDARRWLKGIIRSRRKAP